MRIHYRFFILAVLNLFHTLALGDSLNLPVNALPILVNSNQVVEADLSNTDENLFAFYAEANSIVTIQIPDNSIGNSFNPQIEVFLEDGSPFISVPFDFGFEGEGETLDLRSLPATGFYYLRVTDLFMEAGADRSYQIFIFEPTAPQGGNVTGKVLDICNNQPISRASISVLTLTQSTLSHTTGDYLIARLNPGDYDFSVSANGYQTSSFPVSLPELGFITKNFSLLPDLGCEDMPLAPEDETPDYDPNDAILQLNNVQAGSQNFKVTLKNIATGGGFLFQVSTTNLLAVSESSVVANYDFNSLILTVPVITSQGLKFSVGFIHQGDFVFRIKTAVQLTN